MSAVQVETVGRCEDPHRHTVRPREFGLDEDSRPQSPHHSFHGSETSRWISSSLRIRSPGTATPESDLDLLVRFDRNASLLNHISLKLELEEKLKRKVDVIGDESIFWLIRPQVLAEAIPL